MLVLAGCDKITGAAEQKIADAEAIGFACRVAQKQPEACMKENEAQPPASLLDGWKSADEDIKAGKLDPSMSNIASEKKKDEPAAEGEKKPEDAKDGAKPADGADKKATEEKGADQKDAKSAEMKPADAKKDAAGEAAKKPAEAAHDKPTH
jgi:FtsZ-interacting cell division protein ZipA